MMKLQGTRNPNSFKFSFYNSYANGVTFILAVIYTVYFFLRFFYNPDIGLLSVAMITFGVWFMTVIFSAIEKPYSKENSNYDKNVADLIKATAYMLIIVFSLVFMDKAKQDEHMSNRAPDANIEVTGIKIFEQHENNKIWFGIGYHGNDDVVLHKEFFDDIDKRAVVLKRIFGDDGSFRVEIRFMVTDGSKYVVMSEPLRKMEKASK